MSQQVVNAIPKTPASEQAHKGIPWTEWKLFRQPGRRSQTLIIKNGDPSDAPSLFSLLMKTTIAAYEWVPVADLQPEDAMSALNAFILSHLAHLTVNRPLNTTDEQLRKIAICLGVSRAVSTNLFKLQLQDIVADERAAPLLRASREATGELIYEYFMVERIGAKQTEVLDTPMVLTEVEKKVIPQLVKCGAGILPMQGYSLIIESESGKGYRRAEKAYWSGQDVSTWFTDDLEIIQDVLWHKAAQPVRRDFKTRLALDPSVKRILIDAGAGVCSVMLPATEPELRTADIYLALFATLNPVFNMIGRNVDISALAEMVEIVKAHPVIAADAAVKPDLPDDLIGVVVNRSTALSHLSSMLKRNQEIVAYCYGFYNALSNSGLMIGAAAGTQVDTLQLSYSLSKVKRESHAAYTEGYQSYGCYSAMLNMKMQRGED